MVEVAIFKKSRGNPTNRTHIGTWRGNNVKQVIKEVKSAGVLSSGDYVAFKVSTNKSAFEIDGVKITSSGTPFTH